MIDGSASGFRKNPCITVPAAASAQPTIAARTIRGRRMLATIVWWVSGTSNENTGTYSSPGTGTCQPTTGTVVALCVMTSVGITSALSIALTTVTGSILTGPSAALTTIIPRRTTSKPTVHVIVRVGESIHTTPVAVAKYLLKYVVVRVMGNLRTTLLTALLVVGTIAFATGGVAAAGEVGAIATEPTASTGVATQAIDADCEYPRANRRPRRDDRTR